MSDDAEIPLRITPDMLLSRRVDFERRMVRVPPLTVTLIAVFAVIFAAELAAGALRSQSAIIAAGALWRPAVEAGEAWRLVSAIVLHGGLDHLIGNAIALYIVGMVCEHGFGRVQLAVLFVASGVGGSVLSLATNPGPSVGASGAIFGLTGAAIVLFRRHREQLLLRDRRIGVVLLCWALYTIASGLVSPFVDNAAHVGGAVTGAVLARWLHPVVVEPLPPGREAALRRALWVIGALLAWTATAWLIRLRS